MSRGGAPLSDQPEPVHVPVMLAEVVDALAPRAGATFVDGTFGAGGYARALLEAAECRVVAFDRDPEAIERGRALVERFGDRLTLVQGRFGDMAAGLAALGVVAVDGVAFDLGVSSPQIDQAGRGFSFRLDGPLDMRMTPGQGRDAADLVNSLGEAELADIFFHLGEERLARRVARGVVAARALGRITTTGALAEIVRRAVPRSKDGIDPATRSFQGLRIAVNDELGELDRGLAAAEGALAPGGRLVVVSFHSLEDRRVKAFLRERSGEAAAPSRHAPAAPSPRAPTFRIITRRPLPPGDAEAARNPRARSAKLRAAIRTEAPAWPVAEAAA